MHATRARSRSRSNSVITAKFLLGSFLILVLSPHLRVTHSKDLALQPFQPISGVYMPIPSARLCPTPLSLHDLIAPKTSGEDYKP